MPSRHDFFYVGLQLALFAALALDPWPAGLIEYPRWLTLIGWAVAVGAVVTGAAAVLQLGTNLTPWPSPKAGSSLVTEGLYAHARHPIYAAILYFAMGLTVATGSPWRGLVTAGLMLLFYFKARHEERLLRARYPDYVAYAERVRRFGAGLPLLS